MISAKHLTTKIIITLGVAIAVAIALTGVTTKCVNGRWFKFKSIAQSTPSSQARPTLPQDIVPAQQPLKTPTSESPSTNTTATPPETMSKSAQKKEAEKGGAGKGAKKGGAGKGTKKGGAGKGAERSVWH